MGTTGFDWLAQAGAQNAQRQAQNRQDLESLQRSQALAQNQDASLNIASILRTGIHPDSGQALTPDERAALIRQYKTLVAQQQDLFNPKQKVDKLGKNAAAASGTTLPPNLLRRATDALRITKPQQPAPGSKSPQEQMADLRAITTQYATQPGQKEAQAADAQLQMKLREIDNDPNLTETQKAEARSNLYGASTTGNFKAQQVTLADGRTITAQQNTKTGKWFDMSGNQIPDEEIAGATVKPPETADTRLRSDWDAYYKNPIHAGEEKLEFPAWKTAMSAKGRQTATPESLDKQYQAALVKQQEGRPLSTQDKAVMGAWKLWNQERNIDPGVARAAAFAADRYIPVVDFDNPENVVMMRAGDASKQKASTPASIGFQIDKAITKAFTSGAPANTINYFNTAIDHLKLLNETATALNNNDTQAFNRVANAFASATGDPAPTNFETVRSAVAGELAKTFKGTGASDTEIATIEGTINQAESPAQLQGTINYYLRLMGGKMDGLKRQFEAGKQGKPAFPAGTLKRVSITEAMKKPQNKGKTREQVKADIEAHGYEAAD